MSSSAERPERAGRRPDRRRRLALWVAAVYAVVGAVWIVFSDRLAQSQFSDPAWLSWVQTMKGWLFVGVTAVLLYFLVRSALSAMRSLEGRRAAASRVGREARRALEDRERTLATLMGNLPGMVYRCRNDPDWTMEFVSEPARELTGYSALELIGNAAISYGELIHPEDRGAVWDDVQSALAEGRPYRLTYRIVTRGGETRWVWEQGCGVFGRDGDVIALEGFISDITARREAEEALRRSERKLSLHVKRTPLGVIEWNTDLEVIEWNPSAERIFGYTREEAVGRHVSFLAPEGAGERITRTWRALRAGEAGAQDVIENLTRDGRRIICEWHNTSLIDEQDGVLGIASFVHDRTQSVEREEALRLTQFAVDRALDATYWAGPDGRILYANERTSRLLGYTSEELHAMTVLDINPTLSPESWSTQWEELKRTGSKVFETEHRTRSGRTFPVEVASHYLEFDGSELRCAFARDLTERKKLEQQLFLSQRLEAIGRLAGGVAHDFNNVLMAIMGSSELLLRDLDVEHPGRLEVDEIKNAARRAANLTRQLLAFSRRQVLEPRVLDLSDVAREIEKMLRRLIGEDIELVTVYDGELGSVEADPGQIEQVLMNLAVNARDAMPEGGKLTIETANVELDEEYAGGHEPVKPGSYVMLAMSDTGVGMDAETRSRIFEPFFSKKEGREGTGLGLATVYGIVKQSGGYIWVYSEPGEGTTFKIYLPRVDAEAQGPTQVETDGEVRGGTENVLLVEDEEAVRALISEYLRRFGYSVREAREPAEAIELSERHGETIELLVTDVVLPGMGGRELANRLVASRPGLRVLYLSGYPDQALLHRGRLEPGLAFLQKPFTPDALARKVRQVLDSPARS